MTDQPTPSPAAMVEVRDPCPHCGDHQMIPRVQMVEHLARLHPDQPTRTRHTAEHDALAAGITELAAERDLARRIARSATRDAANALDAQLVAEAALDRVRRLCDLTIRASARVAAVQQARDTLTAINATETQPTTP